MDSRIPHKRKLEGSSEDDPKSKRRKHDSNSSRTTDPSSALSTTRHVGDKNKAASSRKTGHRRDWGKHKARQYPQQLMATPSPVDELWPSLSSLASSPSDLGPREELPLLANDPNSHSYQQSYHQPQPYYQERYLTHDDPSDHPRDNQYHQSGYHYPHRYDRGAQFAPRFEASSHFQGSSSSLHEAHPAPFAPPPLHYVSMTHPPPPPSLPPPPFYDGGHSYRHTDPPSPFNFIPASMATSERQSHHTDRPSGSSTGSFRPPPNPRGYSQFLSRPDELSTDYISDSVKLRRFEQENYRAGGFLPIYLDTHQRRAYVLLGLEKREKHKITSLVLQLCGGKRETVGMSPQPS